MSPLRAGRLRRHAVASRSDLLRRLMALLPAALVVLGAGGCSEPPPPSGSGVSPGAADPARHLVLVTIDTLRADHLGAYGAGSDATPRLDELAARGRVFERAFAEVPLTLPSHATILTGLHPTEHGVRYHGGYRLDPDVTTLAEALAAEGFETGAVIGAWVLDEEFGLDQGFGTYDAPAPEEGEELERRAPEVTRRALDWLARHAAPPAEGEARPEGGRLFLWVHYFDPHTPYDPPPEHRDAFPESPYAGEVAAVDESVGRLVDGLAELRLLDRTLVAVTADHGESLGEHGELHHGLFLHDATLHVPLLLAGPGAGDVPSRDAALVPLSELPRLLLEGLGVERRLPPSRGRALPPQRAYAETFMPRAEFGWSPLFAWRTPSSRYVEAPSPELYDLESDPGATRNLLERGGSADGDARGEGGDGPPGAGPVAEARGLAGELRAFIRETRGATAPRRRLTPAEEERLRSLGYVASGAWRAEDAAVRSTDPDPKDQLPLLRRVVAARAARQSGRAAEAAELLDEVLEHDPDNQTALLDRADLHLRSGAPDEAARLCRRVLEVTGGAPWGTGFRERAHLGLAQVALARRDVASALEHFEAAVEENPDNVEAIHGEAACLGALGRFERAREAYARGARLAPEDPRFARGLEIIARRTGRTSPTAPP